MCNHFNQNIFLAAGLYYLAELVEEYTVMTAKVIRLLTTVRMQSLFGKRSLIDMIFDTLDYILYIREPVPFRVLSYRNGIVRHCVSSLTLCSTTIISILHGDLTTIFGSSWYVPVCNIVHLQIDARHICSLMLV